MNKLLIKKVIDDKEYNVYNRGEFYQVDVYFTKSSESLSILDETYLIPKKLFKLIK